MVKATESGNFIPVKLPEPQTTVARCYSLIHIGTVANIFNGRIDAKRPSVEKIRITWEMPKLLAVFNEKKGEEPFVVGIDLTLSTNENSNLSKLVKEWRGKPLTDKERKAFDPSVMLDKPCLINFNVVQKKKYRGEHIDEPTNENSVLVLNSITPLPKDMTCPKMMNPPMLWDWEPIISGKEEFDEEKFNKIPSWIQNQIKESEEFKKYGRTSEEPNQQSETDFAQEEDNEPLSEQAGW
jgi:hypothetical protein